MPLTDEVKKQMMGDKKQSSISPTEVPPQHAVDVGHYLLTDRHSTRPIKLSFAGKDAFDYKV